MAYTKTNWVNGGPPAIDAINLNHIEDGIYANDQSIANILNLLSANRQALTLDNNNWDSGTVVFTMIGDLAIVGVLNIRRTSPTNGYIDIATLPAGTPTLNFVAGMTYVNTDGNYLRPAAFRVSGGKLQGNTSSLTPSYGFFSFYIYKMG